MKINKEYQLWQIQAWPFSYACAYRKQVADTYLKYTAHEQEVIAKALAIIDAPYKAAIDVTEEAVTVDLDKAKAKLELLTAEDLLIITEYRTIVMRVMRTIPKVILKNMQILKQQFGSI